FLAGSDALPETRLSRGRARPAPHRRPTRRRVAAPMLYSTLAIATRVHTFRRSRMKAIRIHAPGGPEVMKLEDVPEPQPKAGAAIMLQGMTAHYLACSTYPLKKGDTCLVHAAAGGVGLILCQIARLRGAKVIGTVSTDEKAKLAREAGADETILYTRQDFAAEV